MPEVEQSHQPEIEPRMFVISAFDGNPNMNRTTEVGTFTLEVAEDGRTQVIFMPNLERGTGFAIFSMGFHVPPDQLVGAIQPFTVGENTTYHLTNETVQLDFGIRGLNPAHSDRPRRIVAEKLGTRGEHYWEWTMTEAEWGMMKEWLDKQLTS